MSLDYDKDVYEERLQHWKSILLPALLVPTDGVEDRMAQVHALLMAAVACSLTDLAPHLHPWHDVDVADRLTTEMSAHLLRELEKLAPAAADDAGTDA